MLVWEYLDGQFISRTKTVHGVTAEGTFDLIVRIQQANRSRLKLRR